MILPPDPPPQPPKVLGPQACDTIPGWQWHVWSIYLSICRWTSGLCCSLRPWRTELLVAFQCRSVCGHPFTKFFLHIHLNNYGSFVNHMFILLKNKLASKVLVPSPFVTDYRMLCGLHILANASPCFLTWLLRWVSTSSPSEILFHEASLRVSLIFIGCLSSHC